MEEQSRQQASRLKENRSDESRQVECKLEQSRTVQERTEGCRLEVYRSEESRPEQTRTGESRPENMRTEESRPEESRPVNSSKAENEEKFGGPKFSPPLYRQRYKLCADILTQHQVKSVVDFGCAECQIVMYLKQVICLERIALVDKDFASLEMNKYKVRPLITDYLDPRTAPLTVDMFCGSVTESDHRLMDYDAVTMVELIEHLPESELEALPSSVFGVLHPCLVVVTTPNSDFNQLFPDLTGFRHWDHKFEWTKQEFEEWCDRQARLYGYGVQYTGVGLGPPGTEPLGFCSQAAVFMAQGERSRSADISQRTEPCEERYTLVSSAVHPHKRETLTAEEKLVMEVQYCVNHLSKNTDFIDVDENVIIPLENLIKYSKLKSAFSTIKDLRDFLICQKYILTPDLDNVLIRDTYENKWEELEGCSLTERRDQCDNDGQFEDADYDATVTLSSFHPPESEELWD